MAKANVLVVDKTGTLTHGKPEVVKETLFEDFDKTILYSLVKSSNHPVAMGVKKFVKTEQEILFDEYMQVPAKGIVARVNGSLVLGGNYRLMQDNEIDIEFSSDKTTFYYAVDKKVVAVYELQDTLKEGASELVESLKMKNIETFMLTGDHKKSALDIAQKVGISNVHYELSPQDKLAFIEQLHNDGKVVVMVGDGINDVLALAKADIGIVMGSGSDIAIDVGDVVLMNNSLNSLSDAFKISKTTFRLIKQNFAISLIYNGITIPLAMAGLIIPLIAAISMSFSSLLVVGNSMRIKVKWNKG
ncbi:MAG: HAD-IC family P-type ATPase [Sulfurimonas sp.]